MHKIVITNILCDAYMVLCSKNIIYTNRTPPYVASYTSHMKIPLSMVAMQLQ